TAAVFRRQGNMIGIAGHTVPDKFGNDLRAAFAGEFQFFDDKDAGSFTDDESIAVLIERTRGPLRLFIPGGESTHGGKPADTHRGDSSFRTSANHDVGVAAGNHAKRIANRVGAGGARRTRSGIRPSGAEPDGDLASRKIDDARGNKEGRNLPRAAFKKSPV